MREGDDLAEPFLAAIIVTYNPDRKELTELLCAVVAQVQLVLVVDNGSKDDVSCVVSESEIPNCHFIVLAVISALPKRSTMV